MFDRLDNKTQQNFPSEKTDGPQSLKGSDIEVARNWKDGSCQWFRNGILQRERFSNGTIHWYKDGLKHREDGPAVVRLDGSKEYWISGNRYDFSDFVRHVEQTKILLSMVARADATIQRLTADSNGSTLVAFSVLAEGLKNLPSGERFFDET